MIVVTVVFLAAAAGAATSSTEPQSFATTILFIGLVMALFVMPLLLVALVVLVLDRFGGVPVLDYPVGSPLLYETLFWIFGHPEVYLLIFPFTGLFVLVRGVFAGAFSASRGRFYNRAGLEGTILRVMLLSFFVFGHHLLAVRFGLFAKVFFIFASLYIMLPMFDIFRQIFQNLRAAAYRRIAIHATMNTLRRIAAAGFLIGGLSSVFFLFPRFAPGVHGTKVVVGHFHGFFVVFLCSLFLVLIWLAVTGAQLPATATTTCGLFVLLSACAVFFLAAASAGFLSNLRRVVGVGGVFTVYTVATNAALIVGSLTVLVSALYLVATGRRTSGFVLTSNH